MAQSSGNAPRLSVVIPTFNGRLRLPDTLDALARQSEADTTAWEVVVADNGSTDDSMELIAATLESWRDSGRPELSCIHAAVPGVHHARTAGLRIARGQWVAFLDDDNLPHSDWVAVVLQTIRDAPDDLGAFAGQILCRFPSTLGALPGGAIDRVFAGFRRKSDFVYDPKSSVLPAGAGLVVRRTAWLGCVPAELPLVGRSGKKPLGGDDTLAVGLLMRHGWRVWHRAAMRLDHNLSLNRLKPADIITTAWSSGATRFVSRAFTLANRPAPWAATLLAAQMVKDAWVLGRFRLSQPRGHIGANDLESRAQAAFLHGTLVSPWELAKRGCLGSVWRMIRRRKREGKHPSLTTNGDRE